MTSLIAAGSCAVAALAMLTAGHPEEDGPEALIRHGCVWVAIILSATLYASGYHG